MSNEADGRTKSDSVRKQFGMARANRIPNQMTMVGQGSRRDDELVSEAIIAKKVCTDVLNALDVLADFFFTMLVMISNKYLVNGTHIGIKRSTISCCKVNLCSVGMLARD